MPWNIPVFDSTGKIKDARLGGNLPASGTPNINLITASGSVIEASEFIYPVRDVWELFITMRGGANPTDDRYWDQPVYPVAGDPYASVAALNTALLTAVDGEVLILDDGTYDGNVTIPGDRTGVTVIAETLGGVTFDDDNIFRIDGTNCTLMGVKQCQLDINGNDTLIAYYEGRNTTAVNKHYLVIDGHRTRFCYSTLENGPAQLFNINAGTARTYIRIDHNHLLNHLGGRIGASEICQIGQNQPNVDYFALLDSNYVLAHDPNDFTETETISNKSGSNAFIHNVWINCQGRLNDRTATDSYWMGNYIDGGDLEFTGGFTLTGTRALIACNIIKNTNGTDLGGRSAIDFGQGGVNNYQRADDAEASFNTIHDVNRCFGFGQTGSGGELATDPKLYGNAILNKSGTRDAFWITDFTGTLTTVANVVDPPTGITQTGIIEQVPDLTVINNIPVPDDPGNCFETGPTAGYNSIIQHDWFGRAIPGTNTNVGAVQEGYNLSSDPIQALIDASGHTS